MVHHVGLLFSQPPPDGGCRSFSLPTCLANITVSLSALANAVPDSQKGEFRWDQAVK